MKIKINQNLSTPNGKFQKDSIIEIEDIDGIPTDNFWRNRLKDAVIDNCIETITPKKK